MNDEQIVRPAEAERLTGLRRTAFRENLVDTGILTKIQISRRAVGYLKSEVMAFIAERAAAAKQKAAKPNKPAAQPRTSGRYGRASDDAAEA